MRVDLRRNVRHLAGLLLLLLAVCGVAAAAAQGATRLQRGQPVERKLEGGKSHAYTIGLKAKEYVRVVADQRGVDVALSLVDPDGAELGKFDTPSGETGPEALYTITTSAGDYTIVVASEDEEAPPGRYRIEIVAERPAVPADGDRIAAERAFTEGQFLQGEENADPVRQAAEKYTAAADGWHRAGDPAGEAMALGAIGACRVLLGDRKGGLDAYERSLPLYQSVGDLSGEAQTLNEIGRIHDLLGEKQVALDYYGRALPVWRKAKNRTGEGRTLNNLGAAYYDLGDDQKAVMFFEQALPIRRADGDTIGVARTLNNIGAIHDRHGRRREAIGFYLKAYQAARGLEDPRLRASALNNIGVALLSLRDYSRAIHYYEIALPLRRKTGDLYGEATTLANMGKAYDVLRVTGKAVAYYNQTLPIWQRIGDRSYEAATRYELARIERDRGRLDEARTQIAEAIRLVESLRADISNPELRATYFSRVQSYYELYVDLFMRLHRLRPDEGFDTSAFETAERARARSLLEMLVEAHADLAHDVDPALAEQERATLDRLRSAADKRFDLVMHAASAEQLDETAKEIDATSAEFESVQARMCAASERYAALTRPEPVRVDDVRRDVLDPDTALVEFALGRDRSYLWVVTSTSFATYELGPRRAIEAAVRQVLTLMTARNADVVGETDAVRRARVVRADAAFPAASAQLARMLRLPEATALSSKRLLVVADGALQYLPFGALSVTAAGTAGTGAPLVGRFEIANAPSASTIAVLRREQADRAPATGALAVVADPVFDSSDERLRGTGAAPSASDAKRIAVRVKAPGADGPVVRLYLPRLGATRREADRISALVPEAERLEKLDFAATRDVATSEEIGRYRYVHFATHGVLDPERPELSGLVFSLVDEGGRERDGFLRAVDVYGMRLSADMVVLSACSSGLGKEVRGEGLVGLTRGFIYAGSPRVVVSLWSVSDRATADLMERFYRGVLQEGRRPSEALRDAQLEMLKSKGSESPYYWAPFVLQGEWR